MTDSMTSAVVTNTSLALMATEVGTGETLTWSAAHTAVTTTQAPSSTGAPAATRCGGCAARVAQLCGGVIAKPAELQSRQVLIAAYLQLIPYRVGPVLADRDHEALQRQNASCNRLQQRLHRHAKNPHIPTSSAMPAWRLDSGYRNDDRCTIANSSVKGPLLRSVRLGSHSMRYGPTTSISINTAVCVA